MAWLLLNHTISAADRYAKIHAIWQMANHGLWYYFRCILTRKLCGEFSWAGGFLEGKAFVCLWYDMSFEEEGRGVLSRDREWACEVSVVAWARTNPLSIPPISSCTSKLFRLLYFIFWWLQRHVHERSECDPRLDWRWGEVRYEPASPLPLCRWCWVDPKD